MENKVTTSGLAAMIALATGQPGQLCEEFLKELFRIISEELAAGENVRIKGLGTFKLVDIDARKSVDVTTGEDNEIPAHKRVVFVAAREVAEMVNAPFEAFEAVEVADALPTDVLLEHEVADEISDVSDKSDISDPSDLSDLSDRGDEPDGSEASGDVVEVKQGGAVISFDVAEPENMMAVADVTAEYDDAAAEGDKVMTPGSVDSRIAEVIGEATPTGDSEEERNNVEVKVDEVISDSEIGGVSDDESDTYSGADAESDSEEDTEADIYSADDAESDSEVVESQIVSDADADTEGDADEEEDADSDIEEEEGRPSGGFGRGFLWGFLTAVLVCVLAMFICVKYDVLTRQMSVFNGAPSDENGVAEGVMPGEPEILPDSAQSVDSVNLPIVDKRDDVVSGGDVPTQPSDVVVYDVVSTTRYLTTMAKEHYGNFNLWPIIYEENQAILGHPDRIKPGTQVVVPPLSKYNVDPQNADDVKRIKQKGVAIYARFKK